MNDYWLLLLEGAHIEARHRLRKRRAQGREHVPARVQVLIDRIRLERGLEPLYQERERVA